MGGDQMGGGGGGGGGGGSPISNTCKYFCEGRQVCVTCHQFAVAWF